MSHEQAIPQRLSRESHRVAEGWRNGDLCGDPVRIACAETAGDGGPEERATADGPAQKGVTGDGRWGHHGYDARTWCAVPARHLETISGPGTFPDWESWRSGLTVQVFCTALAWRTVCQWPPSRSIAVLRPAGGIC